MQCDSISRVKNPSPTDEPPKHKTPSGNYTLIVTRRWLIVGLTAVFCGLTVLTAMVGIVFEPFAFLLTTMFGVTSYVLYQHASGRLRQRVVRTANRTRSSQADPGRGGFGAGPRGPFRSRRRRARQQSQYQQYQQSQRQQPPTTEPSGLSTAEAYDILDLGEDADQSAIKRAYREKVKTVHPDADTGDADAFHRVTEAYERLSS
ncbi:J domain-containing protein [Halocatena halophila]|uniref:J domain-containing protein n=1 Tax=Halocatena halophila TaxID=2814576 RepID=UPI002ED67205